jgi:transposase
MVDELGIVEWIDRVLPKHQEKQIVSYGQAVKAMILNGLRFNQRTLYLTPLFFEDKPIEQLIGQGIESRHLNDDFLGRTLDAIFNYDATLLYSQLAVQSVNRLGLICPLGHLDSSSFHVDGQYNSHCPPDEDRLLIHITRGYSRDHHPDLNQVALQLICEQQAGLPLLMEPLSGNSSDKVSFRQTIQTHIAHLQSTVSLEYLVADSALYTAETLRQMHGFFWITRVPETLNLAQWIIAAVAPDLMKDRQVVGSIGFCTHYAGVQQRWLIIYSPEAYQRAQQTVNKASLKKTQAEFKAFETLCQQSKPRRPSKKKEPDHHSYQLSGAIASRLDVHQQRLQRKGCFILATNQMNMDDLSDEALLANYKSQQKVERGFRFMKDPLFMASTLFLKSTERIMALMMIMTIFLLVYAALEYRIRQSLRQAQQIFPNQVGRMIDNPTARWVFQFFTGIHLLVIGQMQTLVLNLHQYHRLLLRLLGERYEEIYSGNG